MVAVAADRGHRFSKPPRDRIVLVEGHGVEGDVHAGPFVRHRYLARRQHRLPNLRLVHLIPSELFATLVEAGLEVGAGDLGENISTAGLDLERMPLGTLIELGRTAIVELTGSGRPACSLTASGLASNGTCSRRRKRALHSNAGCWAWCGPADRSRRAMRRGFGSRPPLFARCRPCKDPVHKRATRWPNRNALGRSGWHGRKQGNGGTLGAGEAIDSPGLIKPPRPAGGFFLSSGRVRPRSLARTATTFAPPLGWINGLPQGRNLRRSDYRSCSLLD
ncbi:hypothetical protein ACVW1A_004802 [Bradyrhizobium sp. LB1.3]